MHTPADPVLICINESLPDWRMLFKEKRRPGFQLGIFGGACA
jgi:hypothetical protein